MKRFLAPLALLLGLAVAGGASAQNPSVAAACGTQSLPIGYATGNLIQTQNGNLCTNATGGGGGGSTEVTATAAAPTYVEGSTTNPLSTNLTGDLRTISKQNGTWTVGLSAGTNNIGDVDVLTLPALVAGSAIIGNVRLDQTTPGTTNGVVVNSSALPTGASTSALQSAVAVTAGAVQANRMVPYTAAGVAVDLSTPSAIIGADGTTILSASNPAPVNGTVTANPAVTTTGGCTPGGVISTASTNATSIKGSAGKLCGGMVINTTATLAYLRLYNLAAAPTCSSATGFVTSIPVPASVTGAGTIINFGPWGADFGTGIAACITGGGSSTDNTNAVAGVYLSYSFK